MGVLSDFLVVDRSEAQRVCGSSCPSRDFAGLDAKGIDTVKLDSLYDIVVGGECDQSIHQSICDGGEDGPWVHEVPPLLVQRLASLAATELTAVGTQWAATEEFSPRYDNWPVEDVQCVLTELTALCKNAVTEGKSVLLWMCL